MSATQVEYRQLGKSGLRISVPVLGCMSFGSDKWFPWVLNEDKALPVMKAAWDVGINTFDTANMYSNGQSQRLIAKFMREYSVPRKSMVILDKVFWLSTKDPSVIAPMRPDLLQTAPYVNQAGLSRTAIFSQVNDSLARLETDYIDLLQVHQWDPAVPIEETMKALNDLVVSGKALYIGASNLKAWQVAEMNSVAEKHGWVQFTSLQLEHSLLYRTAEVEAFAYCLHKGIGTLSYAPLMDGHLARVPGTRTPRSKSLEGTFFDKRLRPSDEEIVRRVQQLAQKHGWTMAQVALAWSSTKVSSPIIGANSAERIVENVFTGKALTADELKMLEEPYEVMGWRYG